MAAGAVLVWALSGCSTGTRGAERAGYLSQAVLKEDRYGCGVQYFPTGRQFRCSWSDTFGGGF